MELPEKGDVYAPNWFGKIVLGIFNFGGPAKVKEVEYGEVTGKPTGILLTNDDGRYIQTSIRRDGSPSLYKRKPSVA